MRLIDSKKNSSPANNKREILNTIKMAKKCGMNEVWYFVDCYICTHLTKIIKVVVVWLFDD